MRASVRKCLWVIGVVSLACSSGDITGPDTTTGGTTNNSGTPATVVITPPASSDLFVGQSISLVAAVKNASGVDILTTPVIWSTSDATIATVTPDGTLTGIKVGTVTITGSAGGKSASVTINVKLVPVKSVTVTLKSALIVGETSTAAAVAVDAAGATLTGRTVAWASRNSAVATVSSAGLVTAVAVGSTTIDAVVDGVIGSATVTVAPVPIVIGTITVTLGQTTATVPGLTTNATAVVKSTTGAVLTDRAILWSSSNTDVATVSPLGVVTALATGTAVITASSEGKSGSATFTVNIVLNLPVASVALTTAQTTLSLGKTSASSVVVRDPNGTVLTNRLVIWFTSNPAVASVSQAGLIQANGLGTATITVTSESKSASVLITVIPPPVTNVAVSAPSTNLQPTQTTQAAAVLKDVDGNVLAGRVIVWTSSTPGTATVSASGLVTAVASGTTTITATSEGVASSITITVPAVATINVTAPSTNLQPTQTTQAAAALLDASANTLTNRVLVWASSNPAAATISATGLVTAVASGTTTITATSETKVGSLTITVPAVATINVTAPATNLQPTQTTQASAALLDAGANTLTNRTVVWASSVPAVATVSATGLVTAIASGSTSITATSETKVGTLTITVPAVATVGVTATANFVLAGTTSQMTATPRDASNNALTNRVVTWSSGTPAVATVSASGLVTAVTTGTSTISATSETKVGTFLFTVVPPVGSIAVSTTSNALLLNGQATVSALILDTFGNPVTTIPPVWSSSDATRATVTQAGVVTQVLGGNQKNVIISATAGGVTSSTTIQLTGHAPEVTPALPQTFLNTAAPAAPDVGGVIIAVANGGNLQAALDNAQPGDVIELAASATFNGNFQLKNKGATNKWITIRPSNFASLPAEGSRMTPTIANNLHLPRIETPNTTNAIGVQAGANHYRLVGIEVGIRNLTPMTFALVNTESFTGQTTVAQIPSDIVLDRMWIHGSATQTVRRCVALNSASSAVIDSYLSDCHELGSDSQAIAIWNGPGPFKIVNNYLEAAGENIIVGGSDPSITNLVPSDIEIRRNHFFKPVAWKGVWTVKNLLELKNSQRVLIEGNILQNSWQDAQNGVGVAFKSVNQNGTCSWCVTQDVTYRLNFLENVGAAYNIGASPDNPNPTIHARRIAITDNIAQNINTSLTFNGDGRAFLFDGDLRDVLITHNTAVTQTHSLVFGGQPIVSFTARDNILATRLYAVLGTGQIGGAAFALFVPTGFLLNNVFVAEPTVGGANFGTLSAYPASNFFEDGYTNARVAFASFSGANYTLLGTSSYKSKGTDGADIGANVTAVNAAIAGVIVP